MTSNGDTVFSTAYGACPRGATVTSLNPITVPEIPRYHPSPVADLPSSPQPTTGRGLGLVGKPRRGSANPPATSRTWRVERDERGGIALKWHVPARLKEERVRINRAGIDVGEGKEARRTLGVFRAQLGFGPGQQLRDPPRVPWTDDHDRE